jgi:hypothetical protein
VDLGDDVDPVDDERCLLGHSQGHVQYGTVLRDVDVIASEHSVAVIAETRLDRELDQETKGFVGDALLRIVEVDALALGPQSFASLGVLSE